MNTSTDKIGNAMKLNKNICSNNCDERKEGAEIDMIIIHAMAMDIKDALELLCDECPSGDHGAVSAHYVIDHDGTIYELVSPLKRAWHAGASHWDGRDNLNHYSIGIELLNKDINNGEFFNKPFEDIQIEALIKLIEALTQEFPIKNKYILGHQHVAPSRKTDPGPMFPWDKIRHTFKP